MRCIASKDLWARKHPVVDPETGEISSYQCGKIYKGQEFVWREDKPPVPAVAVPIDPPAKPPRKRSRPKGASTEVPKHPGEGSSVPDAPADPAEF